jgi:Leucine-rich repeat (LRR) protein
VTSDADVLAEQLKPFLTAITRDELEDNLSATSLDFDWLVNNSRFNDYSFDRQIQRFAISQFFYSIKGRLWNQSMGWLTEVDVCSWYQTNNTNPCVNGTLQVLALVDNNLNGTIPHDIGLLGTFEVLSLRSNRLKGSIPIEIKNITSLKILDLQQSLIGEFPDSLPPTLKVLQLSGNKWLE